MYSVSSQRKYWTLSKEQITQYREIANIKYVNSIDDSESIIKGWLLNVEEELKVVQHYEHRLREFLSKFRPRNEPLPKDVKGTSFHFYKRFFLVSSVMDYHPKEMLMTCVYLACKICEYYVPIDMFVKNIGGNQNLMKNIILDQEMELLYRIKFRINIFLPHRAVEGLMIDLKNRSSLQNPDRLYEHINRFLATMWFTDVCMQYSPALIALAAVMHAVSRCRENIDDFVMHTLLECPNDNILKGIIFTVRDIRSTVMRWKGPPKEEEITELLKKLSVCRNPMNNPTNSKFKQRMMEYALESYEK